MTHSQLIEAYNDAKCAHEATTAGTSGRVQALILLLVAELRLGGPLYNCGTRGGRKPGPRRIGRQHSGRAGALWPARAAIARPEMRLSLRKVS